MGINTQILMSESSVMSIFGKFEDGPGCVSFLEKMWQRLGEKMVQFPIFLG